MQLLKAARAQRHIRAPPEKKGAIARRVRMSDQNQANRKKLLGLLGLES
jgi:hypothetical protein